VTINTLFTVYVSTDSRTFLTTKDLVEEEENGWEDNEGKSPCYMRRAKENLDEVLFANVANPQWTFVAGSQPYCKHESNLIGSTQ
jgi:hypothetical protein